MQHHFNGWLSFVHQYDKSIWDIFIEVYPTRITSLQVHGFSLVTSTGVRRELSPTHRKALSFPSPVPPCLVSSWTSYTANQSCCMDSFIQNFMWNPSSLLYESPACLFHYCIVFHSMNMQQLIYLLLGNVGTLCSLKLSRVMLLWHFLHTICCAYAFLVSILGVGLLHHRVCVFNYTRWRLKRLPELLYCLHRQWWWGFWLLHMHTIIPYCQVCVCTYIYTHINVCLHNIYKGTYSIYIDIQNIYNIRI